MREKVFIRDSTRRSTRRYMRLSVWELVPHGDDPGMAPGKGRRWTERDGQSIGSPDGSSCVCRLFSSNRKTPQRYTHSFWTTQLLIRSARALEASREVRNFFVPEPNRRVRVLLANRYQLIRPRTTCLENEMALCANKLKMVRTTRGYAHVIRTFRQLSEEQ